MKYLIILLTIFLINNIYAETTFSDNPNYFTQEGFREGTGNTGLGNPSGINVNNLLGNETIDYHNLTLPTNVTIIQNVTTITKIVETFRDNPNHFLLFAVLLALIWLLLRNNKDKKYV